MSDATARGAIPGVAADTDAGGARLERIALDDLPAAERAHLLGAPISATLAFNGLDGYPRMVPCWFLWADEAFHTTSIVGKYHVRALGRDPRASFCVELDEPLDGGGRYNRQAKGIGDIEILTDPDGAWLGRIRSKYLGDTPLPPGAFGADRVLLRLRPKRVTAHGGRLLVRSG